MLKFYVRLVTPEEAAAMLEETVESGFINRKPSDATIKRYASDIHNENFHGGKTGETVKIAIMPNGKRAVIDGQHRLHAIRVSGIACELAFVDGVDVDMFKYIDGGKPRTLSELMKIDGSPLSRYPQIFSVAGYLLYKQDITGNPSVKPNSEDSEGWGSVLNYVKANYADVLDENATEHMARYGHIQRLNIAPKSLMMYLAVRAGSMDPTLCRRMLDYYAAFGEIAPPHKAFAFAGRMCIKLTEEAKKDTSENRVMKARHKELVDNKLDALVVAWNLARAGTRGVTEASFNRAFNDMGALKADEWPGIL